MSRSLRTAFRAAWLALVFIGSGVLAQEPRWVVVVPAPQPVAFKGRATTTPVVPVRRPNYGAGVAGAILFSAIDDAIAERKVQRMTDAQQKVVDGAALQYAATLGDMTTQDLLASGVALSARAPQGRAASPAEPARPEAEWLVVVEQPLWFVTQDHGSIEMEAMVVVTAPGASAPAFRNTVHAISTPILYLNPARYWLDNSGELLRKEVAMLAASAIDSALGVAQGRLRQPDGLPKLYRYGQGKLEQLESASLLSQRCGRAVLSTAGGALLAVGLVDEASKVAREDCVAKLPLQERDPPFAAAE